MGKKKNKRKTNKKKNTTSSQSKPKLLFPVMGVLGILAVLMVLIPFGSNGDTGSAKLHEWKVVRKLPHDPGAYTQGLIYKDGVFYESTGQYGRSSVRRVDPTSGFIQQRHDLDRQYFGEGLTFFKGVLVQITWRARRAFFYDSSTFEVLREYQYQTEGWGLTTDETHLIMSDGSSTISFRDPQTFEVIRTIQCSGHGINNLELNELEYINGEIWANAYRTDMVLRIDPQTGRTLGRINFEGILADEDRNGKEDVLNGIAYNPAGNEIFITGKHYSYIYQVEIEDIN